jgi:LuxR family transcriptional regulator, maltose regulon positive regulatory protein
MPIPLLATKLYIPPPRSNLVLRPRLLARLNEGLHRKVTLISASAGFGKTTLLSSWIDELRVASCELQANAAPPLQNPKSKIQNRIAWLALDEADSNPTRFLTYSVAAVQTVALEIGKGVMAALQSPQPPSSEAMLTTLLNEIAALPDKFILVLDDYHLIDSQIVDQALAFVIEHMPPQLHLVIATREDPQLPLARLRVRDQLSEVRTADLRFTPSEATAFLNQMMNLNLSVEEVAALESRTEGWIAGLQLAALSMRGRQDVAGFIQAFAGDNRYVVDYLVEEVLQRQPEPVRNFLLQTSILDRLCGALCDAVTNQTESSATLDRLERNNLFVIPLDDRRHWFRYHHLFADLLHTHLLAQWPDQVAILHRRASEWYETQGTLSAAISHAFAAEDMARAAHLIEREWRNHHRSQFRSAAVIDWMKRLPEAIVRASPSLSTGYAWELLNQGELDAAASHLQDAEQRIEANAKGDNSAETSIGVEQLRSLQVDIASARAYLAQASDDLPSAIAYAQRALDLCPADDHLARALMEALLGLVMMANGDLAGAYRMLAAAQRGVQQAGNVLFAIGMTYVVADIQIAQGRLRAAIRTYEEALQLAGVDNAATQAHPVLQGTADLYLGLSDLHYELGNWAEARAYLQKSEELGETVALSNWPYRLRLVQARMKQSEGDLDGALRLLDEAAHFSYPVPTPEVHPLAAMKAQVWIAQGNLLDARAWVRQRGLSVDDDLSFRREFEHITLARLLIVTYRHEQDERLLHAALGFLARLLKAAEAGERLGSVIEILLLQALAQQAAGDIPQAMAPLERALQLAEPEGYIRLFVAEGAAIQQLLSSAMTHGIAERYTERLLAAFPQVEVESAPKSKIQNLKSKMVEPLSQRELEVLHLIAQGFSNQEIGARLFLALDTVKGHNRRIFDKLQVQRRTEAVAKARSLNLLSLP